MAALASERERRESEQRNRRFRKQLSPSSASDLSSEGQRNDRNAGSGKTNSDEQNGKSVRKRRLWLLVVKLLRLQKPLA
jgi:hypothetical protein